MKTRFSLAALLVALLALAPASLAQNARSNAPALPAPQIIDFGLPEAPATSSLGGSVDCNGHETVQQNSGTEVLGASNALGEVGQSFIAPCDGLLTSVSISTQENAVDDDTGSGTLSVFDGLGDGGTLLASVPFAVTGPDTYTFPINAPVLTGASYTFKFEITSGDFGFSDNSSNPYGGGTEYNAAFGTGGSGVFSPDPSFDLVFATTFAPSGPSIDIAVNTFTNTPMRGESVFFRGPVTNTGAATEFVYVYAEVDVPGFPNPFKRNIGGKDLAPGETFAYKDFPKSKNFFPLPFEAPDGTYTITVYAADDRFGTTIYDQDSFSFELSSVCTASASGCLTASLPTVASLETAAPTAAPNPFRGATEIRYALAEDAEVDLRVYDVTGREVALLASGSQSAGSHAALFTAGDLPGGVYVWRLAIGAEVTTGRVTLAR